MPCPGGAVVSTFRYAFETVPLAVVRPSNPASFVSGRIATSRPPPFAQLLNIVACAVVSDI